MDRLMTVLVLLMLAWAPVYAEDAAAEATEEVVAEEAEAKSEPNGNGISSPKTMSGMSILGNEETPKSLVIVPWKSSEMGDAISLSDTLDDRATPVDKEVFLRQLRYYEIRSGEPQD
ncbi:MAG TPA: hypothetical protein VLA11_05040 [Woeseiaceae bacterium]|jgi:hypothetical protein|nr:hypothetical protein [Woeseiaceae bacterium]